MKVEQTPVSREDLEKIASYLSYFSCEELPGRWKGGKIENRTVQVPYVSYDEKVYDFEELLRTSGFTVVFDWPQWEEGRELTRHRERIAQADLLTLRMLLTAIMRNDRFCEGAFLGAIADGLIADILKRLTTILEEEDNRT